MFKRIASGFKLEPLLTLKIIVNTTSKHLRHFWRRKITVVRKACVPYNESSLQRAVRYIAETSKCNLNYASSYQLYIEDSPWIEQSSMSCDSYDCIKLHTLVAFCQPNGTVKLKEWDYLKMLNLSSTHRCFISLGMELIKLVLKVIERRLCIPDQQ